MDPQPSFCPHLTCPSRGKIGAGNLRVQDRKRNRWKCRVCQTTFSGRRGTPFAGLKTDPATVTQVVTLLAFGCPLQAIVHAFGLDERTVAAWQEKAGRHCQQVHTTLVQTPRQVTQGQVDEIRVRCQKRQVLWMALAICAVTRLWIGGEISAHRDKHWARRIAQKVGDHCLLGPLLVVTDGWIAYKAAFLQAFRTRVSTGKRGRPPLVAWPQLVLAQTLKWQEAGRVLGIKVCHLAGRRDQIARLLPSGRVLSTAYIQRLNATFRQRLGTLCRRTRCLVRSEATLSLGMYLVGTLYNFCTPHRSVSLAGRPRTPAMAAGLACEMWSVGELLCYQVAPPAYVAPKRRGRPPGKAARQPHEGAEQYVTV